MIKMIKMIIIILIITNSIFSQEKNMLLLKFNEPLDSVSALNIDNYRIYKYENLSNLNIYNIKFVKTINNIPVEPPKSQIVLFIQRPEYKKQYRIVITNVKDTTGNAIIYDYTDFYFDGIKYEFAIPKPNLRKINE